MKEIKLTQGKVVMVDDDMFDYLNQWKWHYTVRGYAIRTTWNGIKRGKIKMHRLILGLGDFSADNIYVDHIDRNKLNNQKSNLRLATYGQNEINKPKKKNASSKYKGVIYDKERKKWRTELTYKGVTYTKRFNTEREAGLYHNELALKIHGEFAYLNVIED